jgi:hypothetical protein
MQIETKYNIGDKFWMMIDNYPANVGVCQIDLRVHKRTMAVEYYLARYEGDKISGYFKPNLFQQHELDALSLTKEELAAQVFGMNFNQE